MEQKGLVLINTGTGKGKTTAALGTAVRAWGDGQRVLILQFIKGAWKYGELKAIETLGKADGRIEIRPMGDGFVFHNKKDPDNEERLAEKKELARKAWDMVKEEVMSDRWDLVVLDEVNYAIHCASGAHRPGRYGDGNDPCEARFPERHPRQKGN